MLVVDVGRGHSHAHVFRVGSTRVCVQYFFMAQFALPQPQFDNSSDTLSSFPQASSKPCLPATLTPPQRAWCLPCSQARLAPLRSSYLKHLVESGEALQKRQDLPEAAFWDVAVFQRMTESEMPMFSIFALSYRWLTAEHPDPDSFHLSKVVAFLKVHKAFFVKLGANVDDCAVFWDFGSLFQPERTVDQKALFREGLRASNVWYGSFYTTVLIQSHLPPGFTATPYSQSGWCFVEATISSVIKDESGSTREPWSWTVPGTWSWTRTLMTVMDRCGTRRCVPLRPDVVRHLLHTEKKFTTDADKEVVADLYESFFNDVAGSSTVLGFAYLDWTDKEIRDLAGSLRLFEKLEELWLRSNEIGDEGAVALAGALKDLKHLKLVDLEENNIGLVGAAALRDVLQTYTELELEGNPSEE